MMNKVGLVLGVAAIATLAGCKDPNYRSKRVKVQDEPKVAAPVQEQEAEVVVIVTNDVAAVKEVKVVEEVKPIETKRPEVKPIQPPVSATPATAAAAETTTYIVQRGDYLAKISKKFNVTLNGLRKANPQLKNDVIKVGQKIQIPGKHDVGEQTVPAGAIAAPAPKPAYKPYAGATKEYVVQGGDTLGKIAYSNYINIRQLKELNGLSDNNIRIGQKLKIPAEKVAAPAVTKVAAPAVAKVESKHDVKAAADAPTKVETKVVEVAAPLVNEAKKCSCAPGTVHTEPCACGADDCQCVVKEPEAPAAAAAEEGVTHIVLEGEDITGLSIRFSVSPAEIRQLNNLGENDELKAGQVLKLPADTQL